MVSSIYISRFFLVTFVSLFVTGCFATGAVEVPDDDVSDPPDVTSTEDPADAADGSDGTDITDDSSATSDPSDG